MFSRREGRQRPRVAAQANGNWWQFWSACANHHALVGVAWPDTLADAWRLACDAKRRKNQLVMMRLVVPW